MNGISKTDAIVIRSNVEQKKHYREYRETLRYDFCYSCAYCSISESEALGIGFEIDHYYPQKTCHALINDYNNLMWSCEHCNRHKLNFSPNEAQVLIGNIILRIDRDDPRKHYEKVNYRLKGITQTGTFNIHKLNLNRLSLQRIREIREKLWNALEYIAFGVPYIASIKLDLIPNYKQRILFLHIRGEVANKYQEINQVFEELIRDSARSPLLDKDPEEKERLKRRKEYLKEQKMIDHDLMQKITKGKTRKK